MSKRSLIDKRHWALAAAAVAMAAAAVGTTAVPAHAESAAIEQIQRYCATSWRNAGINHQDWNDCTQEALTGLLMKVGRSKLTQAIGQAESEERRELNRSVWRTIQRWRRTPRWQALHEINGIDDEDARDAWDDVMAVGRDLLSERQQRILGLIADGWRISEVSSELGLPAQRVSDEKYKAIAKLRSRLV